MARRLLLQTLLRCSLASSSPHSPFLTFTSFPSPSNFLYLNHDASFANSQPFLLGSVQHYAKRRSKMANDPYAWVKVGENEPCPVSQPNKGSVKNRKHKKRMAQRDAFRKAQVQASIKSCRAAKAKKLEARRKRWKEGAARARAWAAKKEAEAKEAEAKAEAQHIRSPAV